MQTSLASARTPTPVAAPMEMKLTLRASLRRGRTTAAEHLANLERPWVTPEAMMAFIKEMRPKHPDWTFVYVPNAGEEAAAIPEVFLTAFDALFVQGGLRMGELTRRHENGTSKSEAANVHCADL